MTYAKGGTLRTKHPRGSRLPLPLVVTYVQQIASALQEAHNANFIHRDVKPENMLVGKAGSVALSDFGIALLVQQSRHLSTQDVIGTATYMAPEQFAGKPRRASDQYALGIVAYEWLCGAPPFRGTFAEVAAGHLTATPPPLGKLVAVPKAVEQVIGKALAKDPEDRFATIQVFVTSLEQASQRTMPAKTRRSSPLPSARAKTPRLSMTVEASSTREVSTLAVKGVSPGASTEWVSIRMASGKRGTFAKCSPEPATRTAASSRKRSSSRPLNGTKKVRGWVRAVTAMLIVGTALLLCTRMVISAEASLADQLAHAQTRLSGIAWESSQAQSDTPIAESTQTAADFLKALAHQDYRQAYADLGMVLTIQLMPDDFVQQASMDDRCSGMLTGYSQVASHLSGENVVLTYSVVRTQIAPYALTLTFTQDDSSGNYLITHYGENNDLGPTPPRCS